MFKFLANHSLAISIIALGIMFVAFYPAKFTNIDEHDYLQNASLLVHGNLRQVCDGSESQYKVGEYCISKYNIGTSLFLIPAALTTPAVGFAISFVVFLAGVFIFHKFLQILRISTIFTYLYALFPAFVYYSRTMMSETFSATLMLAVVYFLWQEQVLPKWRWGVLAGIAAGLAVLVRYTNVIPLGFIFLLVYLPALWRSNFKDVLVHALGLIIGGLPWLAVLLLFNNYLYGAPLRSGYYFSSEEGVFLMQQVPLFLLRFAGGWSLIYPLMLEIPIFIRTRLSILIVPAIATAVFYAGFPNTTFEGRPLDLILGLRFLVPVAPLLLLAYAAALHKFEDRSWFRAISILGIIGLIALAALLSYQHQQFLQA